MGAKIPAHVREQQINDLPNIQFVRWEGEYRNNESKAVCRCDVDGYEWVARFANLVTRGTGCPQCSGVRRWTAEERIEQINSLPDVSFVRWTDGKYKTAHSKAVCRCAIDGYEWSTTVNQLIDNGTGCPQCSGVRRWTAEERIEQINSLPNIEFVRWAGVFKGGKTKALVKCLSDGFEWPATVMSLVSNGSGCPQCAGNRRWTAEERIQQINERGNIRFIEYVGAYNGATSNVLVECMDDGYQWVSTVVGLLSSKSGCPKCINRISWTENERIEQINKLDNIRFIKFKSGYKTSHSKATVRCEIHGIEWDATVNKLVNGGRGCRQCGTDRTADKRRVPEATRVAQINTLPNTTFIRWERGYSGAHSKAVCRCDIDGFEWPASVSSLLSNGSGCPKCNLKGGYNPSEPGTLYILRSECGSMVKIGISNNHEQRHGQLKRATPFDWHCIELLHSDDGSLIAEWEKELHSWTEQVEFKEPFDGSTEWRKWDNRLPRWIKRYRARLARYNKAP